MANLGGQDDLQRVFHEQNPWHNDGAVPDFLAHETERSLAMDLVSRLSDPELRRFHLILGPRRVGKTTVMYQAVRHLLRSGVPARRLWWLRLDHPVLIERQLDDLVRAAIEASGSGEQIYLFLDEIVYSRSWDLWLKTFYDDRWPVQIVATSSATAALRDRRLESGVGRWQEHYLTPYLFGEFADLADARMELEVGDTLAETIDRLPVNVPEPARLADLRREFLLRGGFPELLLSGLAESDETQLLRSQQVLRSDAVERAIYKDIPQSFGLDSPQSLERLLYIVGGQMTGIFSTTQASSALGMAQPTVDRYLSYLKQAFLVFTLANYSGSELNVQRRGRKIYFVDGAVRNAALQRGLAPLSQPEELGLLMENLVASNLHALALQEGLRMFYWRDGKNEVDLILDHPTRPLAFEIGSSADHKRAGLTALADRYPKLAGRCYLVAPQATFVRPADHASGAGTIPLDLLLVAVAKQAAKAQRRRI